MRGALVFLALAGLALHAGASPEDARRYSHSRGGKALIVWKDGRIILESYAKGAGPNRPHNIYSITKDLSAMSVYAAIGQRWLRLDEPVSNTITEWQRDPRKSKITVRDLLDQTSGLSPGYETLYAKNLKDKQAAVLKLSAEAAPGTTFRYGPSHYEALELLVARKLKRSSSEWLESSVLKPLSLNPAGWRKDREGRPFFSAGASLTPHELLDVGQLVRRNGWRWIFPLFPPSLLKEQSPPANRMYRLGFWLNNQVRHPNMVERDVEEAIAAGLGKTDWARSALSGKAPADLTAMVGSQGQRVYTSASQNLVIVRLGTGNGFRDPDFLREFYR